jgi:hypothetical protein
VFEELVASGEQLTLGRQRASLRVGYLAMGSTALADGRVPTARGAG